MNDSTAQNLVKDECILVVDDEVSIGNTLAQILSDEGYQVEVVTDGEAALELMGQIRPKLVFLDIWMPGLDGIEVLKQIKQFWRDEVSVVMISGHATISTAVESTKLGADGFIEKPFDLEQVLGVVQRCFDSPRVDFVGKDLLGSDPLRKDENSQSEKAIQLKLKTPTSKSSRNKLEVEEVNNKLAIGNFSGCQIKPVVFEESFARGTAFPQRTLKASAILYGQGLHSGRKSGLVLEPLPPNSGIHFVSVANSEAVPAYLDFVRSTGFATTLRRGSVRVGTIEHLLSALHAYGITNLLVKCENEVPVMDGSAIPFCDLLDDVGVEDQDQSYHSIKVDRVVRVDHGREWIQIEPASGFSVDYTLNYPNPIGIQRFVFELDNPKNYRSEIAPARTFGLLKDIGYLQKQGLAQGGRFDNFVLIGDQGPLNGELRFSDEFVRHKILDVIGDLFLLGRRIEGKVTARMTGHSDNVELLAAIRKSLG